MNETAKADPVRAQFEAWARQENYDLHRSTGEGWACTEPAGEYSSEDTAGAWAGWQAALAQQAGAVDDVIRVAVESEREACAKACDDRAAYYHAGDDDGPMTRRGIACQACASVIRWRNTVSPSFLAKHEADIEERLGSPQPAIPEGPTEAAVFRLAFWMAQKDGHDDPHHLIWEGSPPEPWGEVWNRYEDDARSALIALAQHTRESSRG